MMANSEGGLFSCRNTCWIIGGLLGLAVLLLINSPWIVAILVGLVVAVAVGYGLQSLFCAGSGAKTVASTMTKPAAAPVAATTKAEPAAAAASSAGQGNVDAAAVKPAAAVEASASEQAAEEAPVKSDAAATKAAAAAPAASAVKPSKELAGQKELSERKGEWTYEKPVEATPAKAPAKRAPAAKKAPAAKAESKPATAAKEKPAKSAAAKPAAAAKGGVAGALSAPRDGQPDDLKMLKGVGPKIETQLHAHGIYHFDQVAKMKKAEITWLDEQLVGTSARQITGWQPDAKALAAGKETEFSKKAKTSGLYEGNKKK